MFRTQPAGPRITARPEDFLYSTPFRPMPLGTRIVTRSPGRILLIISVTVSATGLLRQVSDGGRARTIKQPDASRQSCGILECSVVPLQREQDAVVPCGST